MTVTLAAGAVIVAYAPLEGCARVTMALFAVIKSLDGFVFGVISVQLAPDMES